MTTQEIAEAVYELIEDKQHWTTGALARDKDGNWVPPESEQAVCWCVAGAAYKVTVDDNPKSYKSYQIFVNDWYEHVGPAGMTYVNDVHGHQAVLNGLDKLRSL
jgi:hypothetical protein